MWPAALLLPLALRAEPESAAVRLMPAASADSRPAVPIPQFPLRLVPERPAGLAAPAGLGPDARYAAVRLGEREVWLALDRPQGSAALGVLYADADGSGRLAPTPVRGVARATGDGEFAVHFGGFAVAGRKASAQLNYRQGRLESAVLVPAEHRRGRALIAGTMREVILVDGDGDGAYDGVADRWLAPRVEMLEKIPPLRMPQTLLLPEPQIPFEADGRALSIDKVAKDGSSLRLLLGAPKQSMESVLLRRDLEVRSSFFERFDEERAAFEKEQGLDPSRPRAPRPPLWRNVTLEEGKSLAARERKPLLVFYYTESNAWCYRCDYYTFRDREVDELLRKFVLVRIDAEKDAAESFAATGARGFPTFYPLTPSGRNVTIALRLRDAELQNEKFITGWQRPQEFAENLRRILGAMR
jgi:hypothetical protein